MKTKTLKLFNAVLDRGLIADEPLIDTENGLIIDPRAAWASGEISDYYARERLSGRDLNATFHKSWRVIRDSNRIELAIHQILHYLSTYGTGFSAETYIPMEDLDLPGGGLRFIVVRALTREQLIEKSLGILRSGVALKEETVDDLLALLHDLDYEFTGREGIKNKEAAIKLVEVYGMVPGTADEMLRYIIYRATGTALLIKSPEVIEALRESAYNPDPLMKKFGLERLAECFNRHKPLFLALKGKCPHTVNRIAKMSKWCHKPMVENPLNRVTSRLLTNADSTWLDNATVFALFKALSACHARMNGQDHFLYRIRNGKSWATSGDRFTDVKTCYRNYDRLVSYLRERIDGDGDRVYIPEDVEYALPTSEKLFVGNIPTGTRFKGDALAVGIYWENAWGANDIDLSGLIVSGGKVGWNASYNRGSGLLMYSGDITDAPNGAVEYLRVSGNYQETTLIMSNIYSGNSDCGYKIVIGRGPAVDEQYMMDPSQVFAEVRCQSVQKQTVLGLLTPIGNSKSAFTVLNFGAGSAQVSISGQYSQNATEALIQQWSSPLTLAEVLELTGYEITRHKENADIDLSLEALDRSTFTELFAT